MATEEKQQAPMVQGISVEHKEYLKNLPLSLGDPSVAVELFNSYRPNLSFLMAFAAITNRMGTLGANEIVQRAQNWANLTCTQDDFLSSDKNETWKSVKVFLEQFYSPLCWAYEMDRVDFLTTIEAVMALDDIENRGDFIEVFEPLFRLQTPFEMMMYTYNTWILSSVANPGIEGIKHNLFLDLPQEINNWVHSDCAYAGSEGALARLGSIDHNQITISDEFFNRLVAGLCACGSYALFRVNATRKVVMNQFSEDWDALKPVLHFLELRNRIPSLSSTTVLNWATEMFHPALITQDYDTAPDIISTSLVSSKINAEEALKEFVDVIAEAKLFPSTVLEQAIRAGELKIVRKYIAHAQNIQVYNEESGSNKSLASLLMTKVLNDADVNLGVTSKLLVDLLISEGRYRMLNMLINEFPAFKEQVYQKVLSFIEKDHLVELTSVDPIDFQVQPRPLIRDRNQGVQAWVPDREKTEASRRNIRWLDWFRKQTEEIASQSSTYAEAEREFQNFLASRAGDFIEEADEKESLKDRLEWIVDELVTSGHKDYKDHQGNGLVLNSFLKSYEATRGKIQNELYGTIWKSEVVKANATWNRTVNNIKDTKFAQDRRRDFEKYVQAIQSPVEDYMLIAWTQKCFTSFIYQFALEVGGSVYVSSFKGIARATQKAVDYIFIHNVASKTKRLETATVNRDNHVIYWNETRDWVRACMSFGTINELQKALVKFGQRKEVVMLQVKYGICKVDVANSTPQNLRGKRVVGTYKDKQNNDISIEEDANRWQDVKLRFVLNFDQNPQDIVLDNTVLCELQLTLKGWVVARKQLGGHAVYSKFRYATEVIEGTKVQRHLTKSYTGHGCFKCREERL